MSKKDSAVSPSFTGRSGRAPHGEVPGPVGAASYANCEVLSPSQRGPSKTYVDPPPPWETSQEEAVVGGGRVSVNRRIIAHRCDRREKEASQRVYVKSAPQTTPCAEDCCSSTQKARVQAKKESLHRKKVHKRATLLYSEERKKGKDGMSAKKVAEAVKKSHGWAPSERTIQQYVNDGLTGTSPLKTGEQGYVPKYVFNTLAPVFESFVRIEQINGKGVWIAHVGI
ncbi:hypothetical protein ACHAWF_016320 [Thalassiosira exigua]